MMEIGCVGNYFLLDWSGRVTRGKHGVIFIPNWHRVCKMFSACYRYVGFWFGELFGMAFGW